MEKGKRMKEERFTEGKPPTLTHRLNDRPCMYVLSLPRFKPAPFPLSCFRVLIEWTLQQQAIDPHSTLF